MAQFKAPRDPRRSGSARGPGRARRCARTPARLLHGPGPGAVGLVEAPNTWGVAFSIPARNQLAAYRAVNPRAVRIGVDPQRRRGQGRRRRAKGGSRAAPADPAKLVLSEREVPEALRALLKDDMDALWIPPDPLLLSDATRRYC